MKRKELIEEIKGVISGLEILEDRPDLLENIGAGVNLLVILKKQPPDEEITELEAIAGIFFCQVCDFKLNPELWKNK